MTEEKQIWEMSDFADEDLYEDGVTFDQFAVALSIWAWMQNRTITVSDSAVAFNTTSELVRRAIESDQDMFPVCLQRALVDRGGE